MKCEICDEENPGLSWTDTHGVAQCCQCGVAYLIYQYEGEGKNRRRIDSEPELAVDREWVPLLRGYWQETGRRMSSGYSFPGGQELATAPEIEEFNRYVMIHKETIKTVDLDKRPE